MRGGSDRVDRSGEFAFYSEGNGELWKVLEQREGWYLIHVLMGDQRCERNGE